MCQVYTFYCQAVLAAKEENHPNGRDIITYTDDRASRLKTITLRGKTATYHYDTVGRLAARERPNGVRVTYAYDAADHLTRIGYQQV